MNMIICILIILFYISFLYIFIPPIYVLQYDQSRIFGFLIYSIIIIISLKKNNFIILNRKIIIFIFFIISYFLISVFFHKYLLFSLIEFSMLYLFVCSTYMYSNMKHDKKTINLFFLILCLIPIYNVVEFFISVLISFQTDKLIGWHGWADNYRFFDSMLLLPICLSLYFFDKKNIFSKYFILLYFFYILMLFFDGARSVLLSILISVILVFYIYPDKRKTISISIVLLFLAFIAHKLYLSFTSVTINSVLRGSTSGRYELWIYGINRFLEKPFFGHGGANFSLDTSLSLTSPHNFLIQFIAEWGIGGVLIICLLFFLYFYLFENREKISPFIFLCAIAILIDGLFSGLFILPMSQMNFMLVIGLLLNQINQHRVAGIVNPSFNYQFYKYIFSIVALFCIGYFLLFHWGDITCLNCMGMEGVNTPRFWRGGKSLHLQEID